MQRQSTGFWSRGRRRYLNALRHEQEAKIAPLRQALKSQTDPDTRRSLKYQIKSIRAEFHEKRKAADSSLFTKT